MNNTDRAFGEFLKARRTGAGLSQLALAQALKWPQPRLSRLEQGKRSVSLPELLELTRHFGASVGDWLSGLDGVKPEAQYSLSPSFSAALLSEDALTPQLARYGVRFLGESGRPSLVSLSAEETLLAALGHLRDPRVFESLPALLLAHSPSFDWTRLSAAAYSLRLQNRLGMVVAAALQLSPAGPARRRLNLVHDALAEAKLDREEVVGPVPRTQAARAFLLKRTPSWMRFWHGLGSCDLESFRRHLPS